jgi:NADPH-dependent 2,4-dienoyl-CoA reductase/sulfur reductase-like enzyme/rhodanese-related sulfurtransferase
MNQTTSETMNVLIVGAVACGAKAAARIRRLDPVARITMIDQGQYISYAGCGLPYYVSGKVKAFDALVKTNYGRTRDAAYFKEVKDIDTRVGVRAESIDRDAKTVRARDLASGEELTQPYDKLVLAMGAAPVTPPIEGADLEGVYHLTSMEDAAAIAEAVKDSPGGSAVIVGAGFIGIEAAEALRERDWHVSLLERYEQILPGALDLEFAAAVQEHLQDHMIEPELGANILRIEGKDGRVAKVVTEQDEYDADLVVMATGVRPNVDLARDAGLTIGETGALAVNARLQTSDPNIYAGGDLVENDHLVSQRKVFLPLGSTANKHGRVIADNVCGGNSEFPGVLGTFVCKAFDLSVGATGLTEAAAGELGLDAYAVLAPGFDKAHYYPDAAIAGLKLVVERETGRLLGAQAVGRGDVARRIDVAATALRFGATIDQLANLDLAYAPPYAQALDCLITAFHTAQNARDGLLKAVTAAETKAILAERDDVILLDVRDEMNFRRGHIDDAKVVNIPLDDLGLRADELPRDKEILCFCTIGLRGYSAQRTLQGAGFPRVATVAGGLFLWPWKDDLA